MKNTTSQIDAALLLEQTGWLRALAWNLVGDTHRAEELTQDTLLTALDRPPRQAAEGVALRAWLAKVARNLARSRHRSDRHRAAREAASARSERLPSVDEAVERTELRQRLVAAILELRTPYREVIILRHLEGLTNAEIAERTNATPEAVRTRLSRGLAMLRERLDAEYGGDRRAWLAICLPLAAEAKGIGVATGASGVATAAWSLAPSLAAALLAVAAIVVVLRGTFRTDTGTPELTPPPVEQVDLAVATPSGASDTSTPAGAAGRIEQDTIDAEQAPRPADASDEQVRQALSVQAPGLELRLAIHPRDPSYADGRSFPRRAGEENLVLGPPRYFALEDASRVLNSYGYPSIRIRIATEEREAFVAWTGEIVGEQLAVLIDGIALSLATVKSPLSSGALTIEGGGSPFTEEEVHAQLAALGFPVREMSPYTYSAVVVDAATGLPLEAATVQVGKQAPKPVGGGGTFDVRVTARTQETAQVSAPGYARVAVGLTRGRGARSHAQRIALQPFAELQVSVLDAQGNPLPGASIVLERVQLRESLLPRWLAIEFDSPWRLAQELGLKSLLESQRRTTSAEGDALFGEVVPGASHRLVVTGGIPAAVSGSGSGVPVALQGLDSDADIVESTWRGRILLQPGERRVLEVRLPALVTLRGRVVGPGGEALARVPVQLTPGEGWGGSLRPMQVAQLQGVPSTRTDSGGYFEFPAVSEGRYLVGVPIDTRVGGSSRVSLSAPSLFVEFDAESPPGQLRLELKVASSILGQIVDREGNPVARRKLWLRPADEGVAFLDATSDAEGQFRFHGLCEGEYLVSPWLESLHTLSGQRVAAGASDVRVVLAPCSLSLELVDTPSLDDAHVSAFAIERGVSPPTGRHLEASGRARAGLSNLEPGVYDVIATTRGGRIAIGRGVELSAKKSSVELRLELTAAVPLELTLTLDSERRFYRVVHGSATVAAGWLEPGAGNVALVPEGVLRVELLDSSGATVDSRSLDARVGRARTLAFDR